jgi:phage shock protein A
MAKGVAQTPEAIQATFEKVIADKRDNINKYKDVVAGMIALEEKKHGELVTLTQEIEKLEKLKAGAAAKAKQVVDRLNGDATAAKMDPEFIKCQGAFKDFSSTLQEKSARASQLDTELAGIASNISRHKATLQGLLRDIDKLKEEKHETVAEVISAKEEKEIADMLNGISQDRSSEELQRLREMRQTAKAGAKVSRELAGLDTKKEEADFLAYAEASVASDEFDQLIGLKSKEEAPKLASEAQSFIPEG